MTTAQQVFCDVTKDADVDIAKAAATLAKRRAERISELSGGAIPITSELLDTLSATALAEFYDELRKTVTKAMRMFTFEISHKPRD